MQLPNKQRDIFGYYINELANSGLVYEIHTKGSFRSIWLKAEVRWFDARNCDKIIYGKHLIGKVKKSVEKYFIDNPSVDLSSFERNEYNYEITTAGHVFNLEACRNNDYIYAVDIDDCYWDCLWRLGYIDNDLYFYGLREDKWKLARNASVGSLGSVEVVEVFKGIELLSKKYINSNFSLVRNHVLTCVWEIIKGLQSIFPDRWLLFQTDCIFIRSDTNPDDLKSVRGYYKQFGFNCKHEVLEFKFYDKINNSVIIRNMTKEHKAWLSGKSKDDIKKTGDKTYYFTEKI